jgi:hypothetical protein
MVTLAISEDTNLKVKATSNLKLPLAVFAIGGTAASTSILSPAAPEVNDLSESWVLPMHGTGTINLNHYGDFTVTYYNLQT